MAYLSIYFIQSELSETQLLTIKSMVLGKSFGAFDHSTEIYMKLHTLIVVTQTSVVNFSL